MQPETGFNARSQSGRSAPPLSASKKRAASWIQHAAEFAAHTDCPFRAFGRASMPCEKNETAIKSPCKILAWAFYCRLGAYYDMSGDGSARQKPFRILLHFRDSAQKVSKIKSGIRIRPAPFVFPAISHHFPLPNPSFKYQAKAGNLPQTKKPRRPKAAEPLKSERRGPQNTNWRWPSAHSCGRKR